MLVEREEGGGVRTAVVMLVGIGCLCERGAGGEKGRGEVVEGFCCASELGSAKGEGGDGPCLDWGGMLMKKGSGDAPRGGRMSSHGTEEMNMVVMWSRDCGRVREVILEWNGRDLRVLRDEIGVR
jgi:hypothetical protein